MIRYAILFGFEFVDCLVSLGGFSLRAVQGKTPLGFCLFFHYTRAFGVDFTVLTHDKIPHSSGKDDNSNLLSPRTTPRHIGLTPSAVATALS